jgi:hypothetical protein
MAYLSALNTLSKCLIIMGVVVKPSPYRWMLWLLIAAINSYCYFGGPNDSLDNQLVYQIFVALDYILLTDVQRELRQVGQREVISNSRLWVRLQWGLQLLLAGRGVGWAHEPNFILPSHPNLTHAQFIKSRLLQLAVTVLQNDIVFTLASTDPGFAKEAPPFNQQPLSWRLWAVAVFWFKAKSFLNLLYIALGLVSVGTGLSEPNLWPDAFGKWTDAYTVRRFWG